MTQFDLITVFNFTTAFILILIGLSIGGWMYFVDKSKPDALVWTLLAWGSFIGATSSIVLLVFSLGAKQ